MGERGGDPSAHDSACAVHERGVPAVLSSASTACTAVSAGTGNTAASGQSSDVGFSTIQPTGTTRCSVQAAPSRNG